MRRGAILIAAGGRATGAPRRPAFAIYCGDTILNSTTQHEAYYQRYPEWYIKYRQAL